MLTTSLNKIVLCATATQLVAGLWHADKLQRSEVFANSEEGHTAFAAFLSEYPSTHVYLLANSVEEDYRLESLPHSAGRSKKELINRKLNQFYRDLNYRTAHFIMSAKDKRKDDKFLFIALNNDEFLQGWMEVIQNNEAQLVGVYLLPMLSRLLIQQFKLGAPHILLCEMLSSGLRQTYFHNGRLRMSRLIPNVPADEKQLNYFYMVETQKTRLYLMSKRLISRDITLNLQLVSLDNSSEHIKQSFAHEPGIDCSIVPLMQYAHSLNLTKESLSIMPELLHMQLLASGHLVDNLAPDALTKQFKLSKLRRVIKAIAIVTASLGMLISAWYFVLGFQHQNNFQEAKQATRLAQLKYNEVAKSFPQTDISAQDLKTAVTLDNTLSGFPKSPRRMMVTISHALEASSSITLNALNWQQTNDLDIQDTNGDASKVTRKIEPRNADQSQLSEIGFMTAEVANFDGNYRNAMFLVNRFVETLKQDPTVAYVDLLATPVNLNSYTDLSGNTTDTQQLNINQAATFRLKVILKPIDKVSKTP
jgi:hypothetical protein